MTQEQKLDTTPALYGRDQVVSIINSVLSKVQEPQIISREVISAELLNLKSVIEELRQQLNAAQPGSIGDTDIPNAKDELDAVVGATEKATTTIMDSCEVILAQMAGENPELLQKTEAEVVKIYEACTFQDITGQRIAKVIKTLKKIDEQVSTLLGTVDTQLSAMGAGNQTEEVSLLNGPALPENAMSQEDIDKLLNSF